MTQLDDRPGSQTDPLSHFPELDTHHRRREQHAAGRTAAIVALLSGVMLMTGVIGYTVAGGRWPGQDRSTAQAPATVVPTPPSAPQAAAAAATTTVPTATAVPAKPTAPPQPTSEPKPAPIQAPPTAQPQPTAPPPTAPPQPTAPAPTAAPAKPAAPSAPAPAAKPSDTQPGVGVPVRPGVDARQAQIEGRIREYFQALNAEEYGRAQEVCCTPEWRSRYPLDQWRRNFSGVSELEQIGAPRYLDQGDDQVVVDTDYTFVSGGARRTFTLRWTFRPVGSEWQAELAEAFPAQ